MVGLRVSDQGVGIEPTLQPRVFDRYFRIQPEGPVSGIGLGLSLVRHIAEQHQGEVDLVSEPGRGSIFTVWFPDTASASSL
jgi:two-component system sensor histidine kinase SenX3